MLDLAALTNSRRARLIIVATAAAAATTFLAFQVFRAFCEILKDSEVETQKLVKTVSKILQRQPKGITFLPEEFSHLDADDAGCYLYAISPGTPSLYYRRSPNVTGLWEWSDDKVVWHSTRDVTLAGAPIPDPATMIFLSRLFLEHVARTMATVGSPRSLSRFPPPLKLSPSKRPLEEAPELLCCPISHQVMAEPVITPSGQSFDRPCITQWLASHVTDPTTGGMLTTADLYPNLALRDVIESWVKHGTMATKR